MMKSEFLHVETPLVENLYCKKYAKGRSVLLKLDNNQPSGSFKIRGIGRSCQAAKEQGYEEVTCASGGNAGIATTYAARMLKMKATIVIFNIASEIVASRIKMEGGTVVQYGNSSSEAIDYAKKLANDESKKRKFIHPFDDPIVWEGNSSLIDELYQQLKGVQPSMIVTCCGGGGLFCGIMKGIEKYNWHKTGVLVMETIGSGCFNSMTKNNYQPVEIKCNTLAKTLSSVIVCKEAAKYAADKRFNVYSGLSTDMEAMEACLLLADQQKVIVEISCGTVLAALYNGLVDQLFESNPVLSSNDGPVICIVCGGNDVNLEEMIKWKKIIDEKTMDNI